VLEPQGRTVSLTHVDNTTFGPTGLPVISSVITIAGHGGTIMRAPSAPAFRLLAVNASGDLTLGEVTLTGGVSDGVLNYNGTLTIEGSTISDNSSGGVENVVHYGSATVIIGGSTISGNRASSGGGVMNAHDVKDSHVTRATATLLQSTITGNTATDDGGIVTSTAGDVSNATLTLAGSLVSGNLAPTAPEVLQSGGNLTANAFNLFGVSGSVGISGFTPGPTDLVPSEPLTAILDPVLADHGGPTLTHALVPGSPALDAIPWGAHDCGTTLFSDQRWQARPQPAGGRCDIGAYGVEVAGQPLSGWVTGLTPQSVTCKDGTTGQVVTLNSPATSWDCEAMGLAVTSGDQASKRVQGPVVGGATDVGGAVVGMTPSSGGCTNLTTGQSVTFQHMVGATAASCIAAGLVVHAGVPFRSARRGLWSKVGLLLHWRRGNESLALVVPKVETRR
jgi:hypothetical protein